MLLSKQFNDTIRRIGLDDPLSDQERVLAEVIWSRCESAFLKQSTQTAALLKSRYVHTSFGVELTQQELQYLSHIVKIILNTTDEDIAALKFLAQSNWEQCDPENPETQEFFDALNLVRDIQRETKTRRNKLAEIQRKLKKLKQV